MNRQAGVTLIELLITIAIFSILAVLASPLFGDFMLRNQIVNQANTIVLSLKYARSEALQRGVRVTVCRSNDQTFCDQAAVTSWETGWIVFVDDDEDRERDAGEELLRVFDADETKIFLTSGNVTEAISFDRNAFAQGHDGAIRICDRERDSVRASAVIISATGQANAAYDNDGDGIVEINLTNITCI